MRHKFKINDILELKDKSLWGGYLPIFIKITKLCPNGYYILNLSSKSADEDRGPTFRGRSAKDIHEHYKLAPNLVKYLYAP